MPSDADAVPSLLEGQVQPDLTITWRDEPRAHQVLFYLRIAELRARLRV